MELGLKDRIVLVTAASAGIGRATAQAFAREGAKLALCARNAASLESVAKQIRAQYGTDVLALPCDVSDAAQIEAMVAQVVATFRHGARAGQQRRRAAARAPPDTVTDADWQRAFELTLMSAVRTTRAVLPQMQPAALGPRGQRCRPTR
jgi:3-oxoacyl-[acyl-carrier protein] reductase